MVATRATVRRDVGGVVHVSPHQMTRAYSGVSMTSWAMDEAAAKSLAHQHGISVGEALVRLGYPPVAGREYDRWEKAERAAQAVVEPEPVDPREATIRRWEREAAEEAAWEAEEREARQDRAEARTLRERIDSAANRLRPSQRPEGQRLRRLKRWSKAEGISIEEADRRHPARPVGRQKDTNR
jgi:hypothetical protein